MNVNPVSCRSLEGNDEWHPDEFFSKIVNQIKSYDSYVGSCIYDHAASRAGRYIDVSENIDLVQTSPIRYFC